MNDNKLITLSEKEINFIADTAKDNFIKNKADRNKDFLTECVVSAFIDFCKINNYKVERGYIYKNIK
jgi:hypothetical protein